MPSPPTVSVITPAYMAEDYIAETMQSVWRQDYRPLEHIVVDDCSPDATGERAREAATRLSGPGFRAHVIRHETNAGTAAGLNTGIAAANGDFISWLSADDLFVAPDKTTRQMRAATADRSIAGVFDLSSFQGPDAVRAEVVRASWPRLLRLDRGLRRFDPPSALVGLLFANPINGTSVTLRRSALPEGDVFDRDLGVFDQDGDLWLRMQALGLRLHGMADAGTLYRIHPGQNSNNSDRMEEGMSIARIRVLLSLAAEDRLMPAILAGRSVLHLGVASGLHHVHPAVFATLVDLALGDARGSLRSTLRLVKADLLRRPVEQQHRWRRRREQAEELRESDVCEGFEARLAREG